MMLRKHPMPHQTEALTAISRAVLDHDRVTTVLACGAGKTLVELWAAQAIGAKRTIVFVPTLSLLQQLFLEWRDQNSWGGRFRSLCVCSDASVGRRDEDEFDLQVEDLGFPTCTSPGVVNEFLDAVDEQSGAHAVVFCTYQSAPVIGQAMSVRGPADRSFGVGIFDEAHKTVGDADRVFSYALHDANLEIDKRLFFTATPRVVNSRGARDAEGDYLVASMDDPAVYGERAYTLGFAEAARRGVIVPYRVVISVVDDASITEEQLTDSLVMADGHVFNARVLASQVALRRTMDNYGLKKAITFHSTIDSAEDFSRSGRADLGYGFDGMFAEHISGRQSAGVRAAVMQRFREAQAGVLSNAKCLTEGIDVPAVDLVAFIDPKKSKVDIVQAAGRAMRKAGPSKTHGCILLPLHLNLHDGESPEEALARSDFSVISAVLKALTENDEVLYGLVRDASLAGARGEQELFGVSETDSGIEFDLGGSVSYGVTQEQLLRAIQTRVVREVETAADRFVSHLRVFVAEVGHAEVPAKYVCADGYGLGKLADLYRRNPERLTPQHREQLTAMGFRWETKTQRTPEEAAHAFLSHMGVFVAEVGHAEVPAKYVCADGYKLGQSAERYRGNPERLTPRQREQLTAMGFRWERTRRTPEEAADAFVIHMGVFVAEEGHAEVPSAYVCADGYRLGTLASQYRRNPGRLTPKHREQLTAIGFRWERTRRTPEEAAHAFLSHIGAFVAEEGHAEVPSAYVCADGYKLGKSAFDYRSNPERLTPQQREQLTAMGFRWERAMRTPEEAADAFVSHMRVFVSEEGHADVLHNYICADGYKLGKSAERYRGKPERLTLQHRELLTAMGFRWETKTIRTPEEAANAFVSYMGVFVAEEGHAEVPHKYVCADGYKLGKSAERYRGNPERLTPRQREQLTAMGFRWKTPLSENSLLSDSRSMKTSPAVPDAPKASFMVCPHNEVLFKMWLKTHRDVYGHCEVPRDRKMVDGYPLGEVLHAEMKAARRANYPQERREELEALGVPLPMVKSRREDPGTNGGEDENSGFAREAMRGG